MTIHGLAHTTRRTVQARAVAGTIDYRGIVPHYPAAFVT